MRYARLKLLLLSLFSAGALLTLNGCYGRTTRNFDTFPELATMKNAVLEESGLTKEELEYREKILREIQSEPEPVYTINAGDKVGIVVYNHPDLAVDTIVTPDGYIGMMFVGQIKIAGLTLVQASQRIEEELEKYVRNPKVGVLPREITSETVTIAGGITKPGMYSISNGMRLADLYALAGGSATRWAEAQEREAADLENSLFVRKDKTIQLDFIKAIKAGDELHNILLRKGDYIYIASRDDSMVYLVGDLKTPSRHIWAPGLGLLELLAIGGWVNETYWHHAIIIRGGLVNPKMYKVDLDGILEGRRSNVELLSGDIVYIPKDDISEYNVFVRKLLPTTQIINILRGWFGGVGH